MNYLFNHKEVITIESLIAKSLKSNHQKVINPQIINYLNNHENNLNLNSIIQLLKLIPPNDRISFLSQFINQDPSKYTFSLTHILTIIKMYDTPAERLSTFKKLLTAHFNILLSFNDILTLMSAFETNKSEILHLLVRFNILTQIKDYHIRDIIITIPDDEKITTLNLLTKDKSQPVYDELLLYTIEHFSENTIEKAFEKYIIENPTFNEDILFKNLGSDINSHYVFQLLNLYVKKRCLIYSQEKKSHLFFKLQKYINDYQEIFNEQYPRQDIIYEDIIIFYGNELNCNLNNLKKLIVKFGYESFLFLNCTNIKKMLVLPEEKFTLILKLFDNQNIDLDIHTLNNILNAFYQREFLFENEDIYSIYHQFEQAINNNDSTKIHQLISKINTIINLSKYLQPYNYSVETFIKKLLTNDHNTKKILHNITNRYIMISREIYIKFKLKNCTNDLNLLTKVQKNLAKKDFYLRNSPEVIVKLLKTISKSKLSPEQLTLINKHDLLVAIIKYKQFPNNSNINPKNKKYLSILEQLVNLLWEEDKITPYISPNIPTITLPKKSTNYELLEILTDIEPNNVIQNLLNDHNLYNALLILMKKYKFLGWSNTFKPLEQKLDLSLNSSSIAGIINYFHLIYPKIKNNNNPNLITLISSSNCYSSHFNKYKYLLGEEDYHLICTNSGFYKAAAPKKKRLETAVNHLIEMYNKKYVAIPSYDKNYILSNGKIINVVVGNSTSTKNLTIGERNDSCLRIYGLFYELYQFIIANEFGFNIVFYDQSNNFISRVSGIRNGNTIFLNELKDSIGQTIKNDDLVETIQLVSHDLLSLTANSNSPIDNIIISPNCAMRQLENQLQYIGKEIFENNLYKLPFNYDMDGYAILMASKKPRIYTTNDKIDNIQLYTCCDDKLAFYEGDKATARIIQLHLINQLLSGISLEQTQIISVPEVKQCISNDKFYVAETINGTYYSFVLDKYQNEPRINEQINYILSTINPSHKLLKRENK